jgi:TPP-dependent pyruvate/acetoin dehydrogenase alpha subunit
MDVLELIEGEQRLIDLWNSGDIPYLFHAAGGNEKQLIEIFQKIKPTDFVFSTHRAHYHARLHGMSAERLEAEVLAGRSMFLFMENFISSSICAGTAAMAAGMAMANQRSGSDQWVYCFIGDGAADEGAFVEALRLVSGRNLPCTFIVEDNDRSVGTRRKDRYGFDPLWSMAVSKRHLIYYTYEPTHPHAGTATPEGLPTRPNLKWTPPTRAGNVPP